MSEKNQQKGLQTVEITSCVERSALEKSIFEPIYRPEEKILSIMVENFPSLGKLAALRFLEWVQGNPGGVVSLPTGKTPEFFIKWVEYFLSKWDQKQVREQLEKEGIAPATKPDIRSLRFVQIDEFYPMDSKQENSFYNYVMRFYINGFGLDISKALLINCNEIGLGPGRTLKSVWPDDEVDLTLRYRQPKSHVEEIQKTALKNIDQWCMEYEQRIREMGGIGFFLGGIGPDGHVGFNIEGSDHNCTTRLCPTNYETQAAAAVDMGGVEKARKSLVITIGLKTITYNPDCTAIIMAAGEAKAPVVARAITSGKSITAPASALASLPNARFYLTRGAAARLETRRLAGIDAEKQITDGHVEKALVHLSSIKNKKLTDLTSEDAQGDPLAKMVLSKRSESLGDLAAMAAGSLERKILGGMNVMENTRFLHTEPHHDDVMLGYFPYIVRHFRRATNTHHFMTLTSGFTSVSNAFMLGQVRNLQNFVPTAGFKELLDQGYFNPENMMCKNRDVWQYLDGVASRSERLRAEGCARRLLRNLFELYDESFAVNIDKRLNELDEYFSTQYPGKRDPGHIQRLKGMCREWEAECLWGYYGWKCDNVHHLRLGFYTGDIFTKDPTLENDVPPIVEMLNKTNPDVVTVAFDPESSGPDTHYKVLQALSEAIKIYEKQTGRGDIKVWGYRNVWYRFDTAEVNIFVPVSLCMFSVMQEAFMNSFLSQKDASFPSYEHDGPFSELAQQIQVEQYQTIKTCLGREWFYNNDSPLIRATRGFVFLKVMDTAEFHESCRELKKSIELQD